MCTVFVYFLGGREALVSIKVSLELVAYRHIYTHLNMLPSSNYLQLPISVQKCLMAQ